jgi:ribosomal protein S18 acetylase RimI-like enzyme
MERERSGYCSLYSNGLRIFCVNLALEAISEKDEFMEMAEKHFRELNPQFVPASDWKECYFENIQGNPNYMLRWICMDGFRAGFVLYGIEPHRFLPRKSGAIYELYVLPEHRRKGIAKACARLVVGELWKASPSKIQLEVMEGNHAALQLWKALGFNQVSERLTLSPQKPMNA